MPCGSDGRAFSFAVGLGVLDFFRRRAMRLSWHAMQKMPCDVRAYRRFSIFLLQLRHLKQSEQKAWSPVRIARSSILFPHALQLYVQLLQIREPSPRRRRFASESSRVPQVLHLKQSMCHRWPAACKVSLGSCVAMVVEERSYRAQMLCLPRESTPRIPVSPLSIIHQLARCPTSPHPLHG